MHPQEPIIISPTTERTYVTVKKAAETYQVNPSTIRRWISQEVLSAIRIGKTTLRVDLSSLKFRTIGGAA